MLIFIIAILLAAESTIESDTQRQIHHYYENIENSIAVDESVWALFRTYTEGEMYAEAVLQTGLEREHKWIELFKKTESPWEMLRELSLTFNSEPLQLLFQLQVRDSQRREDAFHEFYAQSDETELQSLIQAIQTESPVDDFISLEDSPILVWVFFGFYSRHMVVENEDFFNELGQFLVEKIRSEEFTAPPIRRVFLSAAALQTLYLSDAFHAITQHYNYFSDLTLFPNTSLKRNLYWGMDFALFRTGHIDLSLEVQRRHTIPLTRQLGDFQTLNSILAAHGGYLYNLGRYEEAQTVFTTALADTANLDPDIQTRLLNNLSLVYYKLGDNNRYIETQMRALDFAMDLDEFSHQLNIYRNLHIYYRNNRNWDLSLQYIEEALRIAERTDNKNELASIMISKAVYHDDHLNDPERAYELLTEAEELLDYTTDYRLQVRVLDEKAHLYKSFGQFDKSRDNYLEIVSIGSENSNDQMYLSAIVDLANIKLLMDDLDRAKHYIREFNIHDVTSVVFQKLVDARRIEAEIAFREKRYRDAENLISLVYEQVLERARNMTDIESGYWHIEKEYLHLFELYATLLLEENRAEDLVNVLDQLKTINDASLIDNPLIKADMLSDEELRKNKSLTEEIDELRKRLLAAGSESRLDLQNRISVLSAQKSQLTQEYTSDALFQNMNIWAIQSRLRNGEMIIHSTRLLDHFYLVKIDNQQVIQKKLPFGDRETQLFERAIEGLTSGKTDLNLLHQIYTYLELHELPSDIHSLILVPDSYLYQLPIDVLPVSQPVTPTSYGSAEYLIEHVEVRYLNNLQELNRTESRERYDIDFTGFGISDFGQTAAGSELISLPKAPFEINAITEQLTRTGTRQAFLESEATPEKFRAGASNSQILHLASHSKISENDPLFSRIYLHPGEVSERDTPSGTIYAYQLFDMNLRNDLIMLNSCESGSGDYFQGAGIMGISRALRYAGAKSLILNSWAVNDQLASDFAIQFYTSLNEGNTKSRSLREAKIHFLKYKNANPHYWGPYTLNGNTRSIVHKPGENTMIAVLAILFLGGLVLTRVRLNGNGKPAG